MPHDNDDKYLPERVAAAKDYVALAERMFSVGALDWREAQQDYRLVAINSSLRRQNESMRAAVQLCEQGLGHLAVTFVRASFEDVIYLKFFSSLELSASQDLFIALGMWDGLRSLLAQWAYLGDEIMESLRFPSSFLDEAELAKGQVRKRLKALQLEYKWSGGVVPSVEWIADRAGERKLYDYLFAASSRALHFSAGETLRRGWASASGSLITDHQKFREHLAAFALDQLIRLHGETWDAVSQMLERAGIGSSEKILLGEVEPVIEKFTSLGRTALVHVNEWKLAFDDSLSREG